jgi:alpha-mannosidase/mannosylglycerate hydrolase
MKAMRKEVKNPTVLTGESRDPGSTGKWTHLMGDVISARPRLKIANHRAETVLQRLAEPWSAIGSMVGGEYVKAGLDRCWNFLLRNHPHDTITGAGIDQMEKDPSTARSDRDLGRTGAPQMEAVQIKITTPTSIRGLV